MSCTKFNGNRRNSLLYNTHSIIVDVVIFSCSFATFRYEIVLDRIILVTLCHALCTAQYPFIQRIWLVCFMILKLFAFTQATLWNMEHRTSFLNRLKSKYQVLDIWEVQFCLGKGSNYSLQLS